MNKLRVVALLCLALAFWTSAAWAEMLSFSRIELFGDSLSDVGNVYLASGGTTPNPADYWNGRFSNGRVWAEYYAGGLGLPLQPSLVPAGSNSAWGGAETGAGFSYRGTPNMLTQLGMYYQAGNVPSPDTLFIVWGGANDLFHAFENNLDPANPHMDPATIPESATTNLGQLIGSLCGAGAKHVLVPNLPPLGHTPWINTAGAPGEPALYDALTEQFNSRLATTLTAVAAANPGVTIETMDVWGRFNDVIANPGQYGFTNVTDEYALGADPNRYLFWDDVHPTTAAHAIIASIPHNTVPEPGSIVLVTAAGVCLLAYGWRWRKAA